MSSLTSTMFRGLVALAVGTAFCQPAQAQPLPDLILHVDGDNGSPTGVDGQTWGTAFKFLQDGITEALSQIDDQQLDIDTVWIWVAATDSGNPYRPDRAPPTPKARATATRPSNCTAASACSEAFRGSKTTSRRPTPKPTPPSSQAPSRRRASPRSAVIRTPEAASSPTAHRGVTIRIAARTSVRRAASSTAA